jgi:bis(5'-nucleosyl)-tetraphosphatase (symmetrical)
MTTYAIGDVQGCYTELQLLLEKIAFNPNNDTLWFVGDLVNRGPNSLEVLRFLKSLGNKAICVLGNHDFHLLAVAYGFAKQGHHDTLNDVLAATDRAELLDWLIQRPLLYHDLGYTMTHAGIAPQWDLTKAISLATEVENVLASDQRVALLTHLYGDEPNLWSDDLTGFSRWRCIINYFTRMRFCKADGSLSLRFRGEIADVKEGLIPWFAMPNRRMKNDPIIFGHWAALNGRANTSNVFALDTGCVWGNQLTAMNLITQELISVNAVTPHRHFSV